MLLFFCFSEINKNYGNLMENKIEKKQLKKMTLFICDKVSFGI